MLEIFGHPFSSYTWKVFIAFYENQTPFTFRMLDPEHSENSERLQALSPQGRFPVLVDDGRVVFETSVIIEYLQVRYPGVLRLIPSDPDAALDVRMLDRFFDNYVMAPMQTIVFDYIREEKDRDAQGVAVARETLTRSYAWLEKRLEGRIFVCGEDFTLADCAAAPSLFYAGWVHEMPADYPLLRAYRARLLQRPSVKRCVDEARPYRSYFPPGAPDRD